MNFKDRVFAVLYHEEPDQVPFSHYTIPDLVPFPQGEFARELMNKGMGFHCWRSVLWSEMPNVNIETKTQGNIMINTYHTPVGSVTTKTRVHQKRTMATPVFEWMIKDVADYDPVIYMIEDTVFHMDETPYFQTVRDFGGDGVVLDTTHCVPYVASKHQYFGVLKFWSEQLRHPHEFEKLLKALEKTVDRAMSLIIDSPAKIITLGGIDGDYGPQQFKKYDLPFYKKYVQRLHARGKICTIHAHSKNLQCLKDLIPQTGLDVIESFTLPPVGDLSIEEARAAWGDKIVIWAGFPDPMLYWKVEEIKKYTINALRSAAPFGNFIVGMQEQGLSGIIDDRTEYFVKRGLRTLIDVVNKYGRYPIA